MGTMGTMGAEGEAAVGFVQQSGYLAAIGRLEEPPRFRRDTPARGLCRRRGDCLVGLRADPYCALLHFAGTDIGGSSVNQRKRDFNQDTSVFSGRGVTRYIREL